MRTSLKPYVALGISSKTLKINIRYFTQLFLSYIVLLMVAIVGLSFLTVSFVKQYVENQAIQNLTNQLTYIDHIVTYSKEPHALNDVLKDIYTFQGYDFRLTMIAVNGAVYFDSGHDIRALDNHSDRPEVKLANKQGIGSAIRYSKTIGKTLVSSVRSMLGPVCDHATNDVLHGETE